MTHTLSFSRASLGLVPLVAVNSSTATSTIMDWQPGLAARDVTIVQSKWSPGGVATRTRDGVVSANLVLYLRAGSLAASRTLAETWAAALGQLDYTITETFTGASPRVYSAMPATALDIPPSPPTLLNGIVILTATIPRNPL